MNFSLVKLSLVLLTSGLALLGNIKLGRKCYSGTNTLAYFAVESMTKTESYIILTSGVSSIKLFMAIINAVVM
jgi:hypothetical protein